MSEPTDPHNLEIEALSDDDLESVSGGDTTAGGTCSSAGICDPPGGPGVTSGGTCTEKPPVGT